MEWIVINQARPKTGPRPAQYIEDRERFGNPREERERADFRRERGGHKLGEKGTLFLFLVDGIFPFMYLVVFLNLDGLGYVHFPFIFIL